MTVEDGNVVDIVGVTRDGGVVALTIADHLDWEDTTAHLITLQEKLNRYLAFIESGELCKKYPDAETRQVRIDVAFLNTPPAEAVSFLARAGDIIRDAGFDLTWRTSAA